MKKDPKNPIVTSVPGESYERQDPDHLKPKYYNPDSVLQKSGHGSYVELPTGEVYLVHLCARPFVPELRCTLGRETAIQKMMWTEDNWLRMADGRIWRRLRCRKHLFRNIWWKKLRILMILMGMNLETFIILQGLCLSVLQI